MSAVEKVIPQLILINLYYKLLPLKYFIKHFFLADVAGHLTGQMTCLNR